jgi:putative DNA primase/helicase
VVPFDRTFEKVHGVEERIEAELEAEGPGILAWMVRGCLEWQRVGLAPPACIKEAVREYQEEQNPIMTFISDMCITNPHTYISISELYDTYRVWCVNTGEDNPLSKVLFGKVVKELHYRKSRKENVRYWNGITLRKAVMLSKKYLSSEPADEAGLFGEPDDDESYE